MKRSAGFAMLFCLLFLLPGTSATGMNDDWISLGPEGGSITTLAIDSSSPETLYAGTLNGVFKSTDNGNSWIEAYTGMTEVYVYTLEIDPASPKTVYAGTEKGIFKSTDGGEKWIEANKGLPDTPVRSLAIDPADSRILYAGIYTSGNRMDGEDLYRSTDGGKSWTVIDTGLHAKWIAALALDPTDSQIVYAGTLDGVLRSADGGKSWAIVIKGMENTTSIQALAVNPSNPRTLYATTGIGVYKSTDGGNNWIPIGTELKGFYVKTLAIDHSSPETLYAGTHTILYTHSTLEGAGVFKSTDGGDHWTAVNTGLMNMDINTLTIDPSAPRTLYAGTPAGVFHSTDSGDSWTAGRAGLTASNVTAMTLDPSSPETLYAGIYIGGVLKSTDGGNRWKEINTGLNGNPVQILAVDPKSPETVFATTLDMTYNTEKKMFEGSTGMFRSTDGGNHWDTAGTGIEDSSIHALAIDPKSPGILYSGTEKRIYKSVDGGTGWTAVYESATYINATALAIDPVSPQTVYAGTEMAGMLKSIDGGGNWTAVNEGLDNLTVTALAIDPKSPETIYVGITGGIGIISPDMLTVKYTRGGIFKSTNGGRSWETVNRDLNEHIIHALKIDPKSSETVYAIASKGGNLTSRLYRSIDGGKAWTAVSTEPYSPGVGSLAVDPNIGTVYLGTSCCGVIRSTDSFSK